MKAGVVFKISVGDRAVSMVGVAGLPAFFIGIKLKNPGKYLVEKENNNVLDIVAMAGGYEFYANLKSVKVIRQEGKIVRMINLDLTEGDVYQQRNIQLHPGDLVIVPSKKFKEFDKRISTIIAIATTVSSAAILFKAILPL